MNNVPKKKIVVIFLLLVLIFLGWQSVLPCPRNKHTLDWPLPGWEVPFRCYAKRMTFVIPNITTNYPITVVVDGIEVVDQPVFHTVYNTYDVRKNVSLYIDGHKIYIESIVEESGAILFYPNIAGRYILGTRPLLFRGLHTIKLEFYTLSNNKKIREWRFRIE